MSRVWKGQASLDKRLKSIRSPRAQRMLGAALFEIGDDVAADASHSITSGAQSGKGHVVSSPGQPPNEEFGDLRRGIEVLQPETLEVVVQANAAHSVPLEFGTSKMQARPFFRPARDKNRRSGRKKFVAAVNRIVKGAAD